MNKTEKDFNIEVFLGSIANNASVEKKYLQRAYDYCMARSASSENAAIVGYYITMCDIVKHLITIREIKVGIEK